MPGKPINLSKLDWYDYVATGEDSLAPVATFYLENNEPVLVELEDGVYYQLIWTEEVKDE